MNCYIILAIVIVSFLHLGAIFLLFEIKKISEGKLSESMTWIIIALSTSFAMRVVEGLKELYPGEATYSYIRAFLMILIGIFLLIGLCKLHKLLKKEIE